MVQVKLLSDSFRVLNYVLVFSTGDEVLSGITNFAKQYHVKTAHFTAIGALKNATTAWYDIETQKYIHHPINEQVELVSLIGDIAMLDGEPIVHAHFSVAFKDGRVEGGHLIKAHTNPTVELFMRVEPVTLNKQFDKLSGLNLIHIEKS